MGAVIGGAFGAAALSLIMLALGAGFGLSTVSPWSNVGISAGTAGAAVVIWLIFTQIVASAMGGYLAGRLRTRWQAIHNDEVYFRDTANGFLAWAVATVLTVGFLTAAAASMAGAAASSSPNAGPAAPTGRMEAGNYFVDRLFRSEHPATGDDPAVRAEAGRIMARDLLRESPAADDAAYLTQLVAAKTGLSAGDAEKRVADTMTQARQAEDDLRKATAHLLLWIFMALLIGASCASFAATIGGRQRDHVRTV